MYARKLRLPLLVLAAVIAGASLAHALGLGLGETKEQLGLKYDVTVSNHGTGRVTINLTIADEGRLKPLRSVDLVIPNKHKSGFVDLSLSLAVKNADGKQTASAHLLKEWAERAEIHLNTASLDGKHEALTWYYHVIPVADYLKNSEEEQAAPVRGSGDQPAAPASKD